MNKFKFCKLKCGSLRECFIFAVILSSVFATFNQTATAQIGGGGSAIVAVDEVREGSGKPNTSPNPKFQNKTQPFPTEKNTSNKTAESSVRPKTKTTVAVNNKSNVPRKTENLSNKKYDGFVVGDKYSFLNSEVVERVQPIYTIKAKEAGASGLVQVETTVGENGRVLTAKARTGNSLLHAEAEKAALAAVLNKPTVYGKPARAVGFLVYRFGKSEED